MNKFQIGVVATGVLLVLATVALMRQNYAKHDLLGVIPGMTHKQAESVGRARKWGCQDQPTTREYICATGRGKFSMEYLSGGDQTVTGATLQLVNVTESTQSLVDGLSDQYGKKPSKVEGQEPTVTFTWDLGDGLKMQMRKMPGAADISIGKDDLQKRRDNEK